MLLNKRNLENFIRGNISKQNFCVSEVADYFDVSVSYLYDFIAENYGTTLHKLIETYRLEKAIRLISEGVNFKNVCKECGYYRIRTFRGAFKRRLGISPLEFKRMLDEHFEFKEKLVRNYLGILWDGVRGWCDDKV